jgi:hypothetical protein
VLVCRRYKRNLDQYRAAPTVPNFIKLAAAEGALISGPSRPPEQSWAGRSGADQLTGQLTGRMGDVRPVATA